MQDEDLNAVFGTLFAPFRRVVLAVSGGSDSMALMLLVRRWQAAGFAPAGLAIDVATVDHGLRPGSDGEAEWVGRRAGALGFPHAILSWDGEKPGSGLQERAREARYRLLVDCALGAGLPAAVATAHTADDQAETLVMRLGRGSGLDGLAGMARSRPLVPDGSVSLVRPLLGLSKSCLRSLLAEAGETWLEDPSNDRPNFERVRLRHAQAHLAALGLSNDKLALSAQRLMRARDALDRLTEERIQALVDLHGGIYASLGRDAWEAEPEEVRVRMLARLLDAFGGAAKPAQLSQIEALVLALARGRPVAQTLGGCMVSQGRTTLRLYREPGRQRLSELVLGAGEDVLWDGRFRLHYGPHPDQGGGDATGVAAAAPARASVTVRPLGFAAYATLRPEIKTKERPPARAAAGLPAFWEGSRLLAVPSLGAGAPGDGRFHAEFVGFKCQPCRDATG